MPRPQDTSAEQLEVDEVAAEPDRDAEGLWQTSLDLCLLVDGAETILRANPAARTVLGYAPEELVGRRWPDFVHPDDREGFR
jgi:PAS domain S-box-containing protein